MERPDDGSQASYVPQAKEAPTPAVEAPGRNRADVEPEIAASIRKPSGRKPVEAVRAAVSQVVERVAKVQQSVTGSAAAPARSDTQRIKAVSDAHAKRSRAVKRYGKTVREYLLSPAVRSGLKSQGIHGASKATIDAIVAELCKKRRFAGFKASKKGTVERVNLPVDALIAYILGSHALKVEDFTVDLSLNYPTLFDVAVFLMAMGTMVETLATSDVIATAIKAHIRSQQPAEATTPDAPTETPA